MKNGLLSATTVGVSLVSMYVKFGRVRDAFYLFDEMPIRDSFSYNSLVREFGFNGFYEEALMAFEWTCESGFSPDSVSVARVVFACGELGCIQKGLLIHDYVCRNGFGSDLQVINSLISMYVKLGCMDRARCLFNDMPNRDTVSWNSMILGYARSENWVETFDLFQSMKIENFGPNHITFMGLILACGRAEDLLNGKSIHGHLISAGLLRDVQVGTSIVDMYAKCGRVDSACAIFKEDLCERSLVSWNALIIGCSQNGYDHEAVELFHQMLQEPNINPDSITVANLVPACASLGELQRIQLIHGFIIKKGFESCDDVVLGTAMVDAYGKCLDIEAAWFLFSCIKRPNTATWNAMISGYNKNCQPCQGVQLFPRLLQGEVLPDSVTLVTVLQSCGEIGSVKQSMLVHGYCVSSGFDSYITVVNAIIDMYMQCGCMESSQILFKSVAVRNTVTWNTMLCGSVKIGYFVFALRLFRQMLLENQHRPDEVTMIPLIQVTAFSAGNGEMVHCFVLKVGLNLNTLVANSLIDAYAKNGSIDNARLLFEQMGQLRDQSSWNVMIAGFGMNGQGEEACSLVSQMEEDGFQPNSITFISLLSSCSHCGMLDKGHEIFGLMTEKYGIQPSVEHYTCVIDMFGRAGRLEEAYQLIESMPEGLDCDIVWGALLNACKMSMNVELGMVAGEHLSRLAPENCGYHTLLSNVYASAGRWDDAAKVRRMIEDRKLIKKPGLSVVKM